VVNEHRLHDIQKVLHGLSPYSGSVSYTDYIIYNK
jgi:hypothetical protein